MLFDYNLVTDLMIIHPPPFVKRRIARGAIWRPKGPGESPGPLGWAAPPLFPSGRLGEGANR